MAVCQSAEVMQPEYHNSYPRMLSTSADISQQLYYHPLAAFRLDDSLIYDCVVDYVSFFLAEFRALIVSAGRFNSIADNLGTFYMYNIGLHILNIVFF